MNIKSIKTVSPIDSTDDEDDLEDYQIDVKCTLENNSKLYISFLQDDNYTAECCGITGVDGLNDMAVALNSRAAFNEENIKKIIKAVVAIPQKSIILFATNFQHPELNEIMSNFCDFKSLPVINVNSGNPIQLYGFYSPRAKFPKPKKE